MKICYFLIMSATDKILEISPSTEFEHQTLMITVPDDYKKPVSPQSSLSDFSQKKTLFFTLFTEDKNFFT